jgi:4'-phosphopantetheinyl transferase EntD
MDARRLESLFPCEVALECGDPDAVEGELHPLEVPLLERVVEKRRRELVAGRVLARRALARVGLPGRPVLRGEDRAPIWPSEIVGSITHGAGRCAVVVARRDAALGLGLDIEETHRLTDRLLPMICTDAELVRLASADLDRRLLLGALIFSAKESVYKCQYPLSGRWLGFRDVEIALDMGRGTFRATARSGLAPLWPPDTRATGRLLVEGGRVAAASTLERASRGASAERPARS